MKVCRSLESPAMPHLAVLAALVFGMAQVAVWAAAGPAPTPAPPQGAVSTPTPDPRPTPTPTSAAAPPLRLDLHSYLAAPKPTPAAGQWSVRLAPAVALRLVEEPLLRATAHELERGRTHADAPSGQSVLLFSVTEIARLIGGAIKAHRLNSLPPGARVARERTAVFRIRKPPGGKPVESIAVLPLVMGYVGDAAYGPCNERGDCLVDRLPASEFTALVTGAGAVLVAVPEAADAVDVDFRPTGLARLLPATEWAPAGEVTVIAGDSGLTVPIHPALNPERTSSLTLPAHGLTLLLPRGRYLVEAAGRSPVPVTVGGNAVTEAWVGQ